ncbi:unnamed protein product [Allacma fusca]|uniref:WW domain-containing protein n=1 Tax=Allacma fusca TaxID=39272 RepID=A0A8J2P2A6_9HEXA|nr:unnamed protein product [Allacma fusca]
MSYSRFASKTPSGNPLLYTESENAIEPTQEDIEEFARRIGIDLQAEPHLIQLARQGLMEKLPPDWKPCKDSHRDVWFYYNNKTHTSQWDHPMDQIYKDKVIQARQDHAMNRIQSFDMSSPKPMKGLPPLKKSGGGLSPISFPSTLAKLGPLRNSSFSSSDDLSQFSSSQKQLSKLQPLDPLKKEPVIRQRIKMEAPVPSAAPLKKAGLTLMGSGANFLKSAKPVEPDKSEDNDWVEPEKVGPKPNGLKKSNSIDENSNKTQEDDSMYFQPQVPEDTPSPVGLNESSGSESGQGKPLKSILSNSLKLRTRLDENTSTSPRNNLWDISPKEMTDEEFNLWNSLDYKRKTSVKFNLDDPKLVFEFNREESDNPNDSDDDNSVSDDSDEQDDDEGEEEGEEENDDGVSKSDRSNEVSRSLGDKPSSAGDGFITVPSAPTPGNKPQIIADLPQTVQRNFTPVNLRNGPITAYEHVQNNVINKDLVPDRATMKANMEKQIHEFQTKLKEEQKQQEDQIRANMENTISSLRTDMASAISKTKQDFENHKNAEINKARKDMETNLNVDLEKLRNEYKEKLHMKKQELDSEQQIELRTIEQQNAEALNMLKTDPRLIEAGKEYEKQLAAEIQQLKSTMTEQHRKQVDEMKSLHSATIQKLREDFKTEEEKLKKEHADIIVEMLSKFDTEKHNLLRSFETEQEKIKQEFSTKASMLTAELTQQLEGMRQDIDSRQHRDNSVASLGTGSDSSIKAAALKQAEEELSHLKSKYKALEEKYTNLKKGVQSVVTGEKSKMESQNLNQSDSFIIDDPVESRPSVHQTNDNDTDSGAAESDTSYSISSSNRSRENKKDENDEKIQRLMNGGNDRLSQALKALDDLKHQILEIKSEQRNYSKMNPSPIEDKNDKTSEVDTHTEEIQVLHSRKKIDVHNATLPLTSAEVRHVKARVSRSAMDGITQNNKLQAKAVSTKDISEERHYVDEAKDFIKNQKYRLKRSGLSFGTPVSTSIGARQRQEYKLNTIHSNRSSESRDYSQSINQYKISKHHSPDHHSETESSGVGSLKESSGEKSKISQDIEGILSSLQQLDGQMKYLWSVVGNSGSNSLQPQATSTPTMLAPTRTRPDQSNPQIQTTLVGTVNSAQFRRSLDVSTNPALTTLEEHVNNIRHRQSRILKQYPLTGDSKRDRSPSISERTKDLREWLEKF